MEALRRNVGDRRRTGCCPGNLEGDRSRSGRRSASIDGVVERQIVRHGRVPHLERGRASAEVGVNVVSRYNAGPEQTALTNPRIEIVKLRPRTGVIDINSDEAERASTDVAIAAPELTLHETHVTSDEGKSFDDARLTIRSIHQTVGEGDP